MADELTGVNVANMLSIKTRPENRRKTGKCHGIFQPPGKCHVIWRVAAVSRTEVFRLEGETGITFEIFLRLHAGRRTIWLHRPTYGRKTVEFPIFWETYRLILIATR